MKIVTWNVNSLRVRLEQVTGWLDQHAPDVLALQETKVSDAQFPSEAIRDRGYSAVFSGQGGYNGVAVLSRQPASEVSIEILGFDDPQRRVLAATVGPIRVINLYVPNGQEVGSDKYRYKLEWLAAVRDYLIEQRARFEYLVVLGDFNIAPTDADVHDPERWRETIHTSTPEREALNRLLDLGLVDIFRQFPQDPQTFSWWDYRSAAFWRNWGLRIDLILASPKLAEYCTKCFVDKAPRALKRPSDHAPVVAQFEIAL